MLPSAARGNFGLQRWREDGLERTLVEGLSQGRARGVCLPCYSRARWSQVRTGWLQSAGGSFPLGLGMQAACLGG